MAFELEEWVGNDTNRMYRTYPIFGVGPFAAREGADAAAKIQKPQHGGIITVVRKPAPQVKTAPKERRRRVSYRRAGRRNGRR